MGVRRRRLISAVAVAAVLASCAASLPAAPTRVADAVPALATDQACTRQASAGDQLARVPFRTDDLTAMAVPRSALPAAVQHYRYDWYQSGFMDNAEAPQFVFAEPRMCAINRTYGRITSFSRGYVTDDQALATAAHLFFGKQGAHRWLRAYVDGLRDQAGSQRIDRVTAISLRRPAADAVRLAITVPDGSHRTVVLFRHGQVVGEVTDAWATTTQPALDTRATAERFNQRIAARAATAGERITEPFDAVMALSAGLPKARLGARYGGLVWDWYFGGCWDPKEAASQVSPAAARREYLADADRYGQLTFCRSMYVPPDSQPELNRVSRVFTGGTLYATTAGARGSITEVARDWQRRAGTTAGGTTYGALVRFSPGDVGRDAVGLRQRAGDQTYVRILFRRDRYVAVTALVARPFTGMVDDVRGWAQRLDRRVAGLLSRRAA